jgi:hypothetical protein
MVAIEDGTAYYARVESYERKMFMKLARGVNVRRPFFFFAD